MTRRATCSWAATRSAFSAFSQPDPTALLLRRTNVGESTPHELGGSPLFQRIQKVVLTVAALAAFALGGAALAGAASKTTAKSSTTTTQSAPSMPRHGSASHEDAEKPVTGDAAGKAQAAAEKSVGSGSKAGDVVSDFGGNGYEVTVTKADGSKVEVH